MTYFLAGLLKVFVWFAVTLPVLWLIRRFVPWLEVPLFKVGALEGMAMLIRRARLRWRGFRVETPGR